ncbi:MAG: hypothetical protein LBE18_11840 [Planctomycetaceae bacterium]|jgi:hypothetical protein|nr:hypothetical protein [Planctomycetaceae bacterium]
MSQVKKADTKKSPVKKAVTKKSPVKKSVTKKSPVKKSVTKKSPVKKSVTKKSQAKKGKTQKKPDLALLQFWQRMRGVKEKIKRKFKKSYAEYKKNPVKAKDIKSNQEYLATIKDSSYEAHLIKHFGVNGMAAAIARGQADTIIRILTMNFKKPPIKLQREIKKVKSLDQLQDLMEFMVLCESLDDFATAFVD